MSFVWYAVLGNMSNIEGVRMSVPTNQLPTVPEMKPGRDVGSCGFYPSGEFSRGANAGNRGLCVLHGLKNLG